jgi:hypothetical protein
MDTTRQDVLDLRVGELVEVRSEGEILATLDERGELDSLPFMPEMRQFCGRRLRVYKRAYKTCDTIGSTGLRRMENAVHLVGVRCDGQAHGGCQAGCLVYWKEAWLKRVPDNGGSGGLKIEAGTTVAGGHAEPSGSPPVNGQEPGDAAAGEVAGEAVTSTGCTLATLMAATRKDDERYSCQATELLRAAPTRIPSWDVRQYVQDVATGNAGLFATIRAVAVGVFNEYQDFSRRFLPRWLRIHGGGRFPFIDGRLQKTPQAALDLQAGELVRVKSKEEIVATLDVGNRNRGLKFDAEMLKYCGRQARVLRRVNRIVDERTGKMMEFGNPCIILEDVICTSDYHRLCPRAIYPYWREIWLERVP